MARPPVWVASLPALGNAHPRSGSHPEKYVIAPGHGVSPKSSGVKSRSCPLTTYPRCSRVWSASMYSSRLVSGWVRSPSTVVGYPGPWLMRSTRVQSATGSPMRSSLHRCGMLTPSEVVMGGRVLSVMASTVGRRRPRRQGSTRLASTTNRPTRRTAFASICRPMTDGPL